MNSAFDINGMVQEAQNLGAENKRLISEKDFPTSFSQQRFDSFDSKGRRYGKLVTCTRCGARNVTLYNSGHGAKLCKKCKIKMEGER